MKKWMMLEIVDKNAFEAVTLPDNLALIWRFQSRNDTIQFFLHDS